MNSMNETEEHVLIRLAGYTSTWNVSGADVQTGVFLENNRHRSITLDEGTTTIRVDSGHPLRAMRTAGEAGLLHLPHDGERRCTSIDTQASGWISTDLPWERMGGRGEIDIREAWHDGRHPASLSIDVLGDDGRSSHSSIGSVWAFHLSRLSYQFSSSIDGMEVAFSGGAVVTNHPEFKPYVVVPPSDRGGPGPRFAATIPSLHPTASSESGAGELELDIELVHRTSSPQRRPTRSDVDGPSHTAPPSLITLASVLRQAKIGPYTQVGWTYSPIMWAGSPTQVMARQKPYGTPTAKLLSSPFNWRPLT